jgi:hypothetical protein
VSDLLAIAARAAAATPGPWIVDGNTVHVGDEYGDDFRYIVPIDDMRPHHPRAEDAEFIAHARADIPALLATIAALRLLCSDVIDRVADLADKVEFWYEQLAALGEAAS